MNEKKTKVSLASVLLILSVIVIVVMAIIIFKIYQDKENTSNEAISLNAKVTNLQDTIKDLQEEIKDISETENTNSSIDMNKIYLPQSFKTKREQASSEENFEYYIEEEKNYMKVKVQGDKIECTVLDNNLGWGTGSATIEGCNGRVVDVAFEYREDDGYVCSIFLLTDAKEVYACNVRYLYEVPKTIQANLILKNVISIASTEGGYNSSFHTVAALKEDGSYAICFDGEADGE